MQLPFRSGAGRQRPPGPHRTSWPVLGHLRGAGQGPERARGAAVALAFGPAGLASWRAWKSDRGPSVADTACRAAARRCSGRHSPPAPDAALPSWRPAGPSRLLHAARLPPASSIARRQGSTRGAPRPVLRADARRPGTDWDCEPGRGRRASALSGPACCAAPRRSLGGRVPVPSARTPCFSPTVPLGPSLSFLLPEIRSSGEC